PCRRAHRSAGRARRQPHPLAGRHDGGGDAGGVVAAKPDVVALLQSHRSLFLRHNSFSRQREAAPGAGHRPAPRAHHGVARLAHVRRHRGRGLLLHVLPGKGLPNPGTGHGQGRTDSAHPGIGVRRRRSTFPRPPGAEALHVGGLCAQAAARRAVFRAVASADPRIASCVSSLPVSSTKPILSLLREPTCAPLNLAAVGPVCPAGLPCSRLLPAPIFLRGALPRPRSRKATSSCLFCGARPALPLMSRTMRTSRSAKKYWMASALRCRWTRSTWTCTGLW